MLTTAEVRSYQSVRQLRLDLGLFTVVTGPTGSGKSSLIRALELACFNARGTSYVSAGARACYVSLVFGDGLGVAIQRGGAREGYVLTAPGREPAAYTKLAGKVPAEIADLLGMSPLNFARQFDAPFLLADSGGQVARTLGELTNVTVVFEAAREAERRRKAAVAEVRTWEAEAGRLHAQAQGYRTLAAERQAVQEAEAALAVLAGAERLARELEVLTGELVAAQDRLARAAVPEVPDLARLEELCARAARLEDLAGDYEAATQRGGAAWRVAQARARDEQEARAQHAALLEEAGVCPTCGQPVSGGHASTGGTHP